MEPQDVLIATDYKAFERLRAMLEGQRALALVGAGFSARAGYPDWPALLEAMHRQLENGDGKRGQKLPRNLRDHEDVLWRAEEYRRRLEEAEYRAVLQRELGPAREARATIDDCLRALVRIKFRHIITTNYESSLVKAHTGQFALRPEVVVWSDEARLLKLMSHFLDDDFGRAVVFLHGHIDDPASIVLSDRDYAQRYVRSDSAIRRLFAIFAMQRVLFLGFSLKDPDLMAILRQANATVGTDEPRHFAILGVGAEVDREIERSRLRTRFGIDAIFYDSDRPERHGALDILIEWLADRPELTESEWGEPLWRKSLVAGALLNRPIVTLPRNFSGTAADDHGERAAPRNVVPPHPVPSPAPAPSAAPLAGPFTAPRLEDAIDPEDPRKGLFGGSPVANGRELTAAVERTPDDPDWFEIALEVRSTDSARPLLGDVQFFLHDTFKKSVRTVKVIHGIARLDLAAYGAFTVGVHADEHLTRLELDLSQLAAAPRRFRER